MPQVPPAKQTGADAGQASPGWPLSPVQPAQASLVSAATTDRADTLTPLIASAFASYSTAHPRYRFGHDD